MSSRVMWKQATGIIGLCLVATVWLYAADDVKMKLTDSSGVSEFAIQDSGSNSVFRVDSDGNAKLLYNGELRLYNVGNTFYGGFKAPALSANRIWTLPSIFGLTGQCLIDSDGAGTLAWASKENALTFSLPLSRAVDTISIPAANGTTNGYLASGDWTTFNGKESGITAGTTAQYWRGDKSWQTLNWAAIDKATSNIADITTRSHTSLSDIGTNAHSAIDTHIGSTSNPHSVTKAQVGLGSVDNVSLNSWAGSANVLTVGTIGTGIWQGTTIKQPYLAIATTAGDANTLTLHDLVSGAPGLNQVIQWNGTNWIPATAAGGITSLGSQTGATQTFANDTNVTMSSATNIHTLGWTGTLSSLRGGTNLNTSASTGVPSISAGTWSVNATLSASLGGTALNTSASTGIPYISAGTWAVEAQLDETRGGTAQSTYATGDILYASAANTLSKRSIGTTSQILKVVGGVPTWVTSMDNARTTANWPTTSLTLVDVTDMSFAIAANETRSFEFNLQNGCSGTGGLRYALTFPAGATMRASAVGMSTGATAQTSSIMTVSGTETVTFNAANNANGWTRISGCITNGATAGNVQLQFRSITNPQTSTVYQNSYVTSRLID